MTHMRDNKPKDMKKLTLNVTQAKIPPFAYKATIKGQGVKNKIIRNKRNG